MSETCWKQQETKEEILGACVLQLKMLS